MTGCINILGGEAIATATDDSAEFLAISIHVASEIPEGLTSTHEITQLRIGVKWIEPTYPTSPDLLGKSLFEFRKTEPTLTTLNGTQNRPVDDLGNVVDYTGGSQVHSHREIRRIKFGARQG
ncbi:hypothetical protein APZ15_24960 [Burkholderia cepacia ATCC 25416]|nr:hypothetical protein APZ15_24960 [Burkholderia cepacia ATCC 25416]